MAAKDKLQYAEAAKFVAAAKAGEIIDGRELRRRLPSNGHAKNSYERFKRRADKLAKAGLIGLKRTFKGKTDYGLLFVRKQISYDQALDLLHQQDARRSFRRYSTSDFQPMAELIASSTTKYVSFKELYQSYPSRISTDFRSKLVGLKKRLFTLKELGLISIDEQGVRCLNPMTSADAGFLAKECYNAPIYTKHVPFQRWNFIMPYPQSNTLLKDARMGMYEMNDGKPMAEQSGSHHHDETHLGDEDSSKAAPTTLGIIELKELHLRLKIKLSIEVEK